MYFDEIQLNAEVEIAPAVIEREAMLDFARHYDNRPLHTDDAFAETTRFGQLLAPGVMTFMSVWFQYLKHDFCGLEFVAGKSTKIEWIKPVFAGDVLSGRAVVTGLTRHGRHHGLVEITIYAYNQRGELVLTDVTEAVVQCAPEPREAG